MSAIPIGAREASPAFPAPARPLHDAFPRRLREVVAQMFPDHGQAFALVRDFLHHTTADSGFAARLVDAGRGVHGEPGPVRLLAARMLEWQILAIDGGDLSAHRAIFERIGADFDARDGFTARQRAERIAQFRARLNRFALLHRAIDGLNTTAPALDRFLRCSRRPCLVPLARYLFSHDEILDAIYDSTRQSRGVHDPDYGSPGAVRDALATLPEREARLASALAATHEIFWVAERTSSEINSMVEYPLGTVTLAIKPPGSDVEIQIKRAGIRGPRALDVVYQRNGYVVCSTHHLQGASAGYQLDWQIDAEERFAAIWRAVYGEEAPISRTLRVNNIFKMPLDSGGFASIIRYFTDSELYGPGYTHMRGELSKALDNLQRFDGEQPYQAMNDLAQTGKFLSMVRPGQAVQIGTSSFRLDRLARYLSPDGASAYFEELGVEYQRRNAFAFADELLSETLVDYVPPERHCRTYKGYLKAVFANRRNRLRADRNFADCAQQIGTMFGTCVAICAASSGESFVARNVGLRSVFENGAWKLRVIFMDHDALSIPERSDQELSPRESARKLWDDYLHIAGGRIDPVPQRVRGILRLLAGIYRVSPAVRRTGIAAFHAAIEKAFRATRGALPGKLSPFFHQRWIARLDDFDEAVRTFLRAGQTTRAWRESIPAILAGPRPVTHALITQYVRGIGGYGSLWRSLSYLFDPKEV